MDIAVQHAELIPGPTGEGFWKVSADVTRDGVTERHATLMPADAIEWRMAQFNVDAKTALEMILLEPFVTVTHQELELLPTRSGARTRKVEAMAQALGEGSITWVDGPPAWRVGPDEGEPDKLLDSGDGNPLDTILAETPVNQDLIAIKREALDRARTRVRSRAARSADPATPPPDAPRRLRRPSKEELRSRLQLDRNVEAEPSGPADTGRSRG